MSRDASDFLFTHQLDQQQTTDDIGVERSVKQWRELKAQNEWDARSRGMPATFRPAKPVEETFRHRHWQDARAKVFKALEAAKCKPERLRRFLCCGSNCQVEVADDGSGYRLAAFYCGDRFCKPCQASRGRNVRDQLTQLCEGKDMLLVTLTLAASQDSFSVILTHLLASFRRLRNTKLWGKYCTGGAYVVESTLGSRKTHFHVHMHILAEAKFLPRKQLSRQWRKCSKGSFIVHVAKLTKTAKAIKYVSAYASKGFSDEIMDDPQRLRECIVALRGRRLLGTFGGWYGIDVEEEPKPSRGFRWLGSLVELYVAARRGEPWARGFFAWCEVRIGGHEQSPVVVPLKRFHRKPRERPHGQGDLHRRLEDSPGEESR